MGTRGWMGTGSTTRDRGSQSAGLGHRSSQEAKSLGMNDGSLICLEQFGPW